MKFVIHHFLKDLRCNRIWVITWILLLAAKLSMVQLPATIVFMVNLVTLVFGFALLVIVIQQDPLTDSQAFWLSRPLRGYTLLAAKSLFALLILISWILSEVLFLLFHGLGNQIPLAILNNLVFALPAIFVIFGISSLTANLSIFLVVLLAWITSNLSTALFSRRIGMRFMAESIATNPGATALVPGSDWLFQSNLMLYGIAGIAAIIAAVSQYGSRKIKRSVCILVIGLALSAVIALLSPRLIAPNPPKTETKLRLEPIRFGIDEISTSNVQIYNQDAGGLSASIRINGTLKYDANIGPYYPVPKYNHSQFRYPKNFSGSFFNIHHFPVSPWISKQQLQAVRSLLPDWELISETHMERMTIELGDFSQNQFASIQHDQGEYIGKVTVQWIEYRLLGQIPLRAGSQWNGKGYQVNLRSIQPLLGLATHNGHESNFLFGVTVNLENFYIADYLKKETIPTWGQFCNLRFLVAHPKTHKALTSNGYGGSCMHFSPLSGMKVDNLNINFHEQQTSDRRPQFNDDWLRSGVLMILEQKPCGTLIHEVTEKHFSINPKPSNPTIN